MTVKEYLRKIDLLQRDLGLLQPLNSQDENRLWKKFRLEWDYNSNHIEGNTLTYNHVELLLYRQQISGSYSTREVDEMRAHDLAIQMVVNLANDEHRELTVAFIRQLNEIILVTPFRKESLTPSGERSEKLVTPGQYKQTPNAVELPSGEMHYFASPEETPAEMGEMMESYHTNSKSTEAHPAWLAAWMHYQFVRIHPFDDGNGRVAKLIMNYVLLKSKLPPVIIKSDDKRGYLKALSQADAGDLESFVNYIAEQLIWSIELSIKAAKGESIDEANDLNKKIDVLKKKLQQKQDLYSKSKDNESVDRVIDNSIFPLLEKLEESLSEFKEWYNQPLDRNAQLQVNAGYIGLGPSTSNLNAVKENAKHHLSTVGLSTLVQLEANYSLRGYKKSTTHQYMSASVIFFFSEFNFSVRINNDHQRQNNYTYDSGMSDTDRNYVVGKLIDHVIDQIKAASNID